MGYDTLWFYCLVIPRSSVFRKHTCASSSESRAEEEKRPILEGGSGRYLQYNYACHIKKGRFLRIGKSRVKFLFNFQNVVIEEYEEVRLMLHR